MDQKNHRWAITHSQPRWAAFGIQVDKKVWSDICALPIPPSSCRAPFSFSYNGHADWAQRINDLREMKKICCHSTKAGTGCIRQILMYSSCWDNEKEANSKDFGYHHNIRRWKQDQNPHCWETRHEKADNFVREKTLSNLTFRPHSTWRTTFV